MVERAEAIHVRREAVGAQDPDLALWLQHQKHRGVVRHRTRISQVAGLVCDISVARVSNVIHVIVHHVGCGRWASVPGDLHAMVCILRQGMPSLQGKTKVVEQYIL